MGQHNPYSRCPQKCRQWGAPSDTAKPPLTLLTAELEPQQLQQPDPPIQQHADEQHQQPDAHIQQLEQPDAPLQHTDSKFSSLTLQFSSIMSAWTCCFSSLTLQISSMVTCSFSFKLSQFSCLSSCIKNLLPFSHLIEIQNSFKLLNLPESLTLQISSMLQPLQPDVQFKPL